MAFKFIDRLPKGFIVFALALLLMLLIGLIVQ